MIALLRLRGLAAFATLLALPLATVRAKEYHWSQPVSGSFSDAARWQPEGGPPGAGDYAVLDSGGTITVSGIGAVAIGEVNGGDVTLSDGLFASGPSTGATFFVGRSTPTILRLPQTAYVKSDIATAIGVISTGTVHLDNILESTGIPGVAAAINLGFGGNGFGRIFVGETGILRSHGKLLIGAGGRGEVTVASGGLISVDSATLDSAIDLGGAPTAVGKLTLDGFRAQVDAHGQVNVGFSGTGELALNAGADFTADGHPTTGLDFGPGLLLGYNHGANGTVKINASRLSAGVQTVVGGGGQGTVTIENGGELFSHSAGAINASAIIGNQTGSDGAVRIRGANDAHPSSWFNDRDLIVGNLGAGVLEVSDGAQFVMERKAPSTIRIGISRSSHGSVSLVGENTKFAIGADVPVTVGDRGIGIFSSEGVDLEMKELVVGMDSADPNDPIASSEFRIAGLTAEDKAVATIHGMLDVGASGRGNAYVFGDSEVTATALHIGHEMGGMGNAYVDQPSAKLTINGEVHIGRFGAGSLTVTNHGTAHFNNLEPMQVGQFGSGKISVDNFGTLTTGPANIGLGFHGDDDGEGEVTVATGGSWIASGDIQIGGIGYGTLDIAAGGHVQAPNTYVGERGELKGNDRLSSHLWIQDEGKFAPGNSPGRFTVDGDFTQLAGGILEIEIAGSSPSTEYDVVEVNGSAQLGGILQLLFDDFTPAVGQQFDFFNASNVVGNFDEVRVAGLPANMRANVMVEPTGAHIVIANVPEPATLIAAMLACATLGSIARKRENPPRCKSSNTDRTSSVCRCAWL